MPDYDPRRLAAGAVALGEFARVTLTDRLTGEKRVVEVAKEGHKSEDEMLASALRFVEDLRRLEKAVQAIPDKWVERGLFLMAEAAGYAVAQNLIAIGKERFGAEVFGEAFHQGEDPKTVNQAAYERHVRLMRELLEKSGRGELSASVHQDALVAALQEFEEQHDVGSLGQEERDRLFGEALESDYDRHLQFIAFRAGQEIAQQILEGIRPSTMPLEELVGYLRGSSATQAAPAALVLPTHPVGVVMNRGLIQQTLENYEEMVRLPEESESALKVRTSISLDTIAQGRTHFERQEDVLTSIQKKLLEEKRHSAALLKLNLDLTNCAYNASGELPVFEYNFAEALERMGYAKNSGRRGFHNETMRALRERLITLQSHRVAAWHTKRGNREYLEATPYWIVETYRYNSQEPLGLVDLTSTLLRMEDTTAYTGVTIRPGLWWATTNMKQYRFSIPESVLQLPTDGNGNERERMALLLAAYLAIHVRRNQHRNAGKSVSIRAGTLLEQGGIVTEADFFAAHSTVATRIRDRLHDLEDQGAIPLLRELGAFNVWIRDEADFFATNRGWRERFWNATLEVEVPDLGIPKLKGNDRRRA